MKVYKIISGNDTYYSFKPEDASVIKSHKIIQTRVDIDTVPLEALFEAADIEDLGFNESPQWFYNHMKAVCGPERAERIIYNMFKEKGFEWVL